MALSDDQRAMLRLLAQREQGYEDIAALMGLSVDDVRAKVKDALAQLEDEGVAAPPLPPEPPAAPEPEPPAPEPTPVAPAPTPAPTPAAEAPAAPHPAAAATPPPAPPPAPAVPKKPRDKNMLLAIGGGALAVVVIVVLAVLLISNSGGDSDSGDATTTATDSTSQTTANGDENLDPTMAVLKAVDGGSGSGTAVFGNFEETLVLAVEAKGLEPTAAGTQYAIAIAASPTKILPIATTAVGAKGTIEASVKLPAELLLFLANETYSEIVITRANTARLKAEIKKESKEPAYVGTPVLRGEITGSLVGNEEVLQQVEEEKAAEEAE
ncbi:MAG TPA: hypothetical protein VHR18_07550 [Solirubrobacterales bacterium]|jgi:hypothetical protein|nr:hypothetical protein [Solirubrobacterales bacterium]